MISGVIECFKWYLHKKNHQRRPSTKSKGLYMSCLFFLLELPILTPLWSFVKCILKDKKKFTMTIHRKKKLRPWIAEVYQMVMLAIFAVALWQMPNATSQSVWLYVFVLGLYRAWEIFVIGLKWLFVDEDPLHSHRRSLVCFFLNLLEISAIYTMVGYPIDKAVNGQQFLQVLKNVGKAFRLEMPPLDGSYAILFSVESAIIIIFVLASVMGGIQRRT